MAFTSSTADAIIAFIEKTYPNVGGTARSSLRSALYRLRSDASPHDVYTLVSRKLRAAGYYDSERTVTDALKKARITW